MRTSPARLLPLALLLAARAASAAAPVIKLLEPGKSPAKPLRIKAAEGDKGTLIITLRLDAEAEEGKAPPKAPPIRITLSTKVTAVDTSGAATVELGLSKAEALD